MVSDISIIENELEINSLARRCMKFWPGALTLIFKYKNTPKTIGIRIPNQKDLLSLLKEYEKPLAVTSANLSGNIPIISIEEAQNIFMDKISYYFDFKATKTGIASTIVDVTSDKLKVLRQGDLVLGD